VGQVPGMEVPSRHRELCVTTGEDVLSGPTKD
jgi:hypothetical protein